MKKMKLDEKLIICVFVVLVLQVIYITAYSFFASEGENGLLSLFAAILALEVLAVFTYCAVTIRRFMKYVTLSVLSLKDIDEGTALQGFSFGEIDGAVEDVRAFYREKLTQSKKMLSLFEICLRQPITSELYKDALPLIMDIAGADACAYYSVNYGSSKLELVDSCGFGRELYQAMDTDIGEGLEGACFKSGRICFFAEGDSDDKYNTISSVAKKNFKNIMAVPISDNDRCTGVLTLAYISIIKKENITAAKQMGELLASAHYGSERHEKFLRQADELTLQNRIIGEISEEIKEKDSEIERLKTELEKKS